MKISIVLQVLVFFYEYRIIRAIYGFGDEPEDPDRVRIYLDDDEKLLVPKNSKIEYINPVIDYDEEVILDKPPTFSTYASKVIKKPVFIPSKSYLSKQFPLSLYGKPSYTFEDPRMKEYDQVHSAANFFGGFLGTRGLSSSLYHHAPIMPQIPASPVPTGVKQHPISYGQLLRPILILPNGWVQGMNWGGLGEEKPVTEVQPDDLKYDFRTKTHSIR